MNKIAYVTQNGLCCYKRMPFGLEHAPAAFQKAVNVMLSTVKWQCALLYIDEVVNFSSTLYERSQHVGNFLKIVQEAGMTLKVKKCHIFSKAIDNLWHDNNPEKFHVATKTDYTVQTLKYPTTPTDLWSFVGLCNVYRRFLPKLAKKAAPLNQLLRKGPPTKLVLDKVQLAAVDELNNNLNSLPILALTQDDKPYVFEIDACDAHIGFLLLHEQDKNGLGPVGYWSRSSNDVKRRYDTTQKEFPGVVWDALLLRPLIEEK